MSRTPRPTSVWSLVEADPVAVDALVSGAGLSPVLARILVARGASSPGDAKRFLSPDLERDWRSPEEIPGMPAAADAVADAVRGGRDIVVFGDFDVDGVTAAAVAARGLASMGARVVPTVPHRFREGYGLGEASVARLMSMAPDLIVTVDCGISSADEVATLRERGIDVVVTDHHEPGPDIPRDVPVTDPKLPGSTFEGLAGAGVALKLVHAVGSRLGAPDAWLDLVDLAAVGTVGDIVPLIGENRALVAAGLARIRAGQRPSLTALAEAAALDPKAIRSSDVAYGLVPRINAAGRMADPAEALELLMTDEEGRAASIAAALHEYNRARRAVESDLADVVEEEASRAFGSGRRSLVLAGEGWHEGVRGIVAARVARAWGVPSLLFTVDGDEARGSGRSVSGIDLHAAVLACAPMLTRWGGHAAAVGITLPVSRLDEFASTLEEQMRAQSEELFRPRLSVDAEVDLSAVDMELAAELGTLEPYGASNPSPILATRSVFMTGRKKVGADSSHLRFSAYDGLAQVNAIAFRCPDIGRAGAHDEAVDLAYEVDVNEWRGTRSVQLNVRDLAYHDGGAVAAAELVGELFADAEAILARGDYEGISDADSFHTKLAGVTFEGRQEVLARLGAGDPLRLVRQPENEFDPNACALFDTHGDQVGFFNRRLAAALAPAIDAGADWDVAVTEVTGGGEGKGLGVNVLVSRPTALTAPEEEERNAARRSALAGLDAAELDAAIVSTMIGDRELHPAQTEALEHLRGGRSCLCVMATGRGKSLIFHAHAARAAIASEAASVFVYPLRALVADQAFHLSEAYAELGLRTCVLTGESSLGSRDEEFASLADGGTDVVLTTPEFLERNAERFAASGRIGFVVVDEAHHVGLARSGHRPAYGRLGEAIATLGSPTVLAVTATASAEVAAAIRETLGVTETVTDPTVRENLGIADGRATADKVARVAALAARGEKVICYVNSREQSVRIAERVRAASPRLTDSCAFYNGGLNRPVRHAVESAFRSGDVTAVVATSAFGEGIDIPDVRHVVLFHLPFNSVEFNQMCGRAGRDGAPAQVHLLFGEKDARLNEMILESSAPDLDDLRALYGALRDRAATTDDGWVEMTNADLAADVKARRPRARLSERGASTGIGIFRELGLVSGEGTGSYRRLRMEPAPAEKIDLASSVRYEEGLREVEDFARFKDWALRSAASELLEAFNRPILPDA